jgi:hypothetical protein
MICSPETSVSNQLTLRNNAEDAIINFNRSICLRSQKVRFQYSPVNVSECEVRVDLEAKTVTHVVTRHTIFGDDGDRLSLQEMRGGAQKLAPLGARSHLGVQPLAQGPHLAVAVHRVAYTKA